MINRDLYKTTSAADDGSIELDEDGAEVVWLDEKQQSSTSWLDDFDFEDYLDDEPTDRIGGLWSRYGASGTTDRSERVIAAQKLVQGFVDTFATGDLRYIVTFDESIRTAGTDFGARKVVISHKPLFDPTLSADEANTILTAMGCHEASHVRYGRATAAAAKPLIAQDRRAATLSNVLDDYRIERRFVADYPGFQGVFEPATAYVARTTLGGATRISATELAPIDMVISAVLYTKYVDWTPETAAERDWWLDWAARWSKTDRGSDHVKGVREGLDRLNRLESEQSGQPDGSGGQQPEQPEQPEQDEQSGSGGQPSAESTENGAAENGATGGAPDGGRGASQEATFPVEPIFPVCAADGIEAAADAHGASTMSDQDAQILVTASRSLVYEPITKRRGEIYYSPAGIVRGRARVETSRSATAAIRAAFARSRTGHFATERGMRSGRLDNRSLPRIASTDTRLFAKRTAPSEGRYLVWLMVDCSGSMAGLRVADAATVALTLASAVRFLPNVTLDVWGWRSEIRQIAASFAAVRVYHSGETLENIGLLQRLARGGTPDAEALAWAAGAISKAAGRDVTPVIIMTSDGVGTLQYDVRRTRGTFVSDLSRKYGVKIVSVAFGELDSAFQRETYGERGYIDWRGSITATAKPLGELVARIATGRA